MCYWATDSVAYLKDLETLDWILTTLKFGQNCSQPAENDDDDFVHFAAKPVAAAVLPVVVVAGAVVGPEERLESAPEAPG